MKTMRLTLICIAFILIAIICYSSYQLGVINRNNAQEANIREWLMQYHPITQISHSTDSSITFFTTESLATSKVNQSIVDLQAVFPDVIGWLNIPNTRIDYPFVQGMDNDQYLHMDLNHNRSAAGTIFMDYHNSRNLSDFNTIIYGHHMRSGSMFASLQSFSNRDFFENNRSGTIFLADKTYEIEFMAFAVVQPNDTIIYNSTILTDSDRISFFDHVASIARNYRDIGVAVNDRIVTFSTCNYEFNNARMVLIGRIN